MLHMSTPFVAGFFENLFDSGEFMPHGHCYFWNPSVLWANVIGDAITALAYFSIPVLLFYFTKKRKDIAYPWVFWLFGLFILSCGTTHIFEIYTIWVPVYRLEGLIKVITGVVSIITAGVVVYIMPDLLKIPTNKTLEQANQLLKEEIDGHMQTERELKENQRQLNEAQQLAAMGSWEWDVINNVVTCSDGLYTMYGLPTNASIQRVEDLTGFVHPDDRDKVDDILQRVMVEKQQYEVYYRIVTPTGLVKYIHGRRNVELNENGEIAKILAISLDVTQSMVQEKELQAKTEQLERTVNHLRKFAYATSHDLKEPIRGMIGYAQMLQTKYKGELNDEMESKLDLIAGEGKRLVAMVESVMEFSRAEVLEKKTEVVDMQLVVNEVKRILQFNLQQNNVELVVEPLPKIMADHNQVLVLMQNLIGNAIKYNESLKPRVEIKVLETQNHFWHFTVSDNGIGFDMKYGQRIFEMFRRLNSRKEYQGSGIGLAICKNVVESYGGKIWAESVEGVGSKFHFTLPKA